MKNQQAQLKSLKAAYAAEIEQRKLAQKCKCILLGYATLFLVFAGLGGYTVHMAVTQPDLNKIE